MNSPIPELRSTRQRIAAIFSSPWMLPAIAFVVSECLLLAVQRLDIRFLASIIPMKPDFIRDVVGMVFVLLVPWHGWVFTICLLTMLYLKSEIRQFVAIFLLSSAATGVISSLYAFSHPTFPIIGRGILTYLCINLYLCLIVLLIHCAIKGVVKCLLRAGDAAR